MTQLCGLERRTAWGGRDSIDHGPGSHDDIANAVVGALLAAAPSPAATPIFFGEREAWRDELGRPVPRVADWNAFQRGGF